MLNKGWRPTPPRPSSSWKSLLSLAVFLTICAVVLAVVDRPELTVIFIGLTLPTSFVAGYFFRADLQRRAASTFSSGRRSG